MTDVLDCFKAYDVRGRIPDQLNEDIARRIGKAYAEVIQPGTVVVGHDIRLTSESIKGAVIEGLLEQGVSVQDIGLCGTEEIYFATAHLGVGGGIAVTASHNPKDYNGMKFVGRAPNRSRGIQALRRFGRWQRSTILSQRMREVRWRLLIPSALMSSICCPISI
jgi:phosphomannomutase